MYCRNTCGPRTSPFFPSSSYYGSSSAVYRARLKLSVAALQPVIIGDIVIKITYNYDHQVTDDALYRSYTEANLFHRLPRHPNIVHIAHSFIDNIPTSPSPPDWDADPSLVDSRTLFMIMELHSLTLQQVISYRQRKAATSLTSIQSLFTAEEILLVARDISAALILLGKELVAHRDIKPDNIFIRLPPSASYMAMTREQVLENIYRPGVVIALVIDRSRFHDRACSSRYHSDRLCIRLRRPNVNQCQ